jgi:glycosyltransferase involved in cell wall biosynthesis
MLIDLFVDFSRLPPDFDIRAAIARLSGPDLLGEVLRQATCAVSPTDAPPTTGGPDRWKVRRTPPTEACRDAIAAAADAECPLLVLFGDIQPGREALGIVSDAIESDPMIGFAVPRLTGTAHSSLARLDLGGDPAVDELPRRLLAEIPETYLVADVPGRCLLIKPVVLANFGELDGRFRTLGGALWHYAMRARRCGFRSVVCNRAVVTAPCHVRPCPPCVITRRSLPAADRVLLRELAPDVERTLQEFGPATAAAAETRLARALYQAYDDRPSLLLDARNLVAGANGTTIAILGLCGGLHALRSDWNVTVLASADASAFHRLEDSFPGWTIATRLPSRQFTLALRLSQPWNIQEMVDLHAAAAFNACFFLDTIAWDIAYPAPRHLAGTWQFMADHADAILFDSAYTRDRLHKRFRVRSDMRELVAYLSFDPADYVRTDVRMPASQEPFIFIVGNEYDHKDVTPTMELLSTAFPYERIVALGGGKAATPLVTVLQSGALTDAEIHRLYRGARLVVFPSFYEGFGFPVLTTLAYGGTVVARQSPLLEEIAMRCAPRGRLVPFTRRDELVDIVGRILHGRELPALRLGAALENGRPMSWQDVAEQMLAFLTDVTADVARSGWRSREHAIAQLAAAPVSLVEKGLRQPSIGASLAARA